MAKRRLLLVSAGCLLLAGCSAGVSQVPALPTPGTVPTIYKSPGLKPYTGKMPLRVLWPAAAGYNCNAAIYYPGSKPKAGGSATSSAPGSSKVTVEQSRLASVEVSCLPDASGGEMVHVQEFPASQGGVGLPITHRRTVRIGPHPANEGTLAGSSGQGTNVLTFTRSGLDIAIEGPVPKTLLEEIGLSLHP